MACWGRQGQAGRPRAQHGAPVVRPTSSTRWQSVRFQCRPRRAGTSIVAGTQSAQSVAALDGSRGPRGSAVRFEPTGCHHRPRGSGGTRPGGATRRLEPVGRQTLGAAVRLARNGPCSRRQGQSPVSRIEPCRRGAGASAESAQRSAAAQQRRGLKVGSQAPRGPASAASWKQQARGSGWRGCEPQRRAIQRGAGAASLARGAGAHRAPAAGRLDHATSAIARVLRITSA